MTCNRVGEVYYSSLHDEIFVVIDCRRDGDILIKKWECRSLEDSSRNPWWQSDSSFEQLNYSRVA